MSVLVAGIGRRTYIRRYTPAVTMTTATTAAGIPQDRNVACNGKDDVPVTQSARSRPRVYKIVVLGDGGVGKSGIRHPIDFEVSDVSNVSVCTVHCNLSCFSAVTLQFVSHRFLDYHDPTIGEFYSVGRILVLEYR